MFVIAEVKMHIYSFYFCIFQLLYELTHEYLSKLHTLFFIFKVHLLIPVSRIPLIQRLKIVKSTANYMSCENIVFSLLVKPYFKKRNKKNKPKLHQNP